MAALNLDEEMLAASLWRAFCHALGRQPGPWEHLSLDDQAPFLRMARRGAALLEAYEGKSYNVATAALAQLAGESTAGAYEQSPAVRLAFQAVCKHLMILSDADDVTDLDKLERSWGEWAAKRVTAYTN